MPSPACPHSVNKIKKSKEENRTRGPWKAERIPCLAFGKRCHVARPAGGWPRPCAPAEGQRRAPRAPLSRHYACRDMSRAPSARQQPAGPRGRLEAAALRGDSTDIFGSRKVFGLPVAGARPSSPRPSEECKYFIFSYEKNTPCLG